MLQHHHSAGCRSTVVLLAWAGAIVSACSADSSGIGGKAGSAGAAGSSTATASPGRDFGGDPSPSSAGSGAAEVDSTTPIAGAAGDSDANGGNAAGATLAPGSSGSAGTARGSENTGGSATGGSATGGSATGGSATGGSATGGSATGGSAGAGSTSGGEGPGGAGDGGAPGLEPCDSSLYGDSLTWNGDGCFVPLHCFCGEYFHCEPGQGPFGGTAVDESAVIEYADCQRTLVYAFEENPSITHIVDSSTGDVVGATYADDDDCGEIHAGEWESDPSCQPTSCTGSAAHFLDPRCPEE